MSLKNSTSPLFLSSNMDQIHIREVSNVYLNVYICSESQPPLPFLSRDVTHSYRPREKHETEVRFSNTRILLRPCTMRTDVIRKFRTDEGIGNDDNAESVNISHIISSKFRQPFKLNL